MIFLWAFLEKYFVSSVTTLYWMKNVISHPLCLLSLNSSKYQRSVLVPDVVEMRRKLICKWINILQIWYVWLHNISQIRLQCLCVKFIKAPELLSNMMTLILLTPYHDCIKTAVDSIVIRNVHVENACVHDVAKW